MRSDSSRGGLGDRARLVMSAVLDARAYWPPHVNSGAAACVLLTAIALQESDGAYRRQMPSGPGRSWWQLEPIAVEDVLRRARAVVAETMRAFGCQGWTAGKVYDSLVEPWADVMSASFARAFLWLAPGALPHPVDEEASYTYYLRAWRPGKPRPERWKPRLMTAYETYRWLAGS